GLGRDRQAARAGGRLAPAFARDRLDHGTRPWPRQRERDQACAREHRQLELTSRTAADASVPFAAILRLNRSEFSHGHWHRPFAGAGIGLPSGTMTTAGL